MMARPLIGGFAYGFALSEGLAHPLGAFANWKSRNEEPGIEARLWLKEGARSLHAQRRRKRAGPVGCGLCGVESLEQALPPITPVHSEFRIDGEEILAAMALLAPLQFLYRETRAVHAAAFYTPAKAWSRCAKTSAGTTRSTN